MRPDSRRLRLVTSAIVLVLLTACRRAADLSGEWVGTYPCCGEETIRLVQSGDSVVATKVTGDNYIPAGEVTWRANLRTGVGEGRVAGAGFVDPTYTAGTLEILGRDRIRFAWGDAASGIEFRRRQ